MSVFNGTNPNGTWKLLVRAPEPNPNWGGKIAGGWSLAITTSNTVCCSSPDLSLNMADSPDPVTVGSNLTYTLIVSNVSPAVATGVIVSNALPPGVAFVSAASSQGSCASATGRVTCNLGTLAAGASATVTIVVIPSATGTITNTASVTRDGADPNPIGNTATVLTTVNPVPGLSIADATLTEGNVGTTNLLFPVLLSVVSAQPVAVNYATSDGSAVGGSDYFAINGTVTFNPGETFKTISVLNDVRLRFTTIAGRSYRVEWTYNLTGPLLWTVVAGAESVPGAGASVEVMDTGAGNYAQRFYQIRLLP